MAEAAQGQPAPRPLPPGLDLLWGRRERRKRGPRPALSADDIAAAAIRLADAEGLEAVSMARVASELGFTPMALYRYIANKEELLQLMWNASALGSEHLVIEGTDWRSRLRAWAVIQRDMLDRHPWITQMPMAAPPVAPNSLHFVERGLETMDDTFLADSDKLRVIGLLSSYTLSEARMAADAMRAAKAAAAAAGSGAPGTGATAPGADGPGAAGGAAEPGRPDGAAEPPENFEALLRELVDARTYPHLYRLAWDEEPDPYGPQTEREQFLFGVDTILDGIQALIDRTGRAG
jgi:AcrR family transcriptional regulator